MGTRGASIAALVLTLALLLAASGCGADDTRYGDERIVERLHLEQTDGGYQLAGNPFCVLENKLLNDSGEVQDAADGNKVVVASREGNVGVVGSLVPRGDCAEVLRKRLNKLDPAPK
jgi:hypothetical protein